VGTAAQRPAADLRATLAFRPRTARPGAKTLAGGTKFVTGHAHGRNVVGCYVDETPRLSNRGRACSRSWPTETRANALPVN
jgi:hypothetical protein